MLLSTGWRVLSKIAACVVLYSIPMNYFKTLCCCFIYLFITACNIQAHVAPINKFQAQTARIEKTAVIKTTAIKAPAEVSAVQAQSKPPLNLSINDVTFDNQKNNDAMLFNDNDGTENNSALFDELSKKNPDRRLKVRGELLTDKSVGETDDIIKSVNGIQINVQGKFN